MANSIARSVAVRRRALRAKLRHIGWGAIELAGGVLLVVALAVGGFYWRLSQGDISLGFVTQPIERAINAGLTGYSVDIEDTVLEKVEEGRGVSFRLKGLVLRSPDGAVIAAAPKAEIGLSMRALLFGRILPSRVELIGAQLALVYDPQGRLRIGLDARSAVHEAPVPAATATVATGISADAAGGLTGVAGESQSFADGVALLRNLLAGNQPGNEAISQLEEIAISETRAVFIHQRLGRQWSLQNGEVRLSLRDDALHLEAGANLSYQGKPIPIRAQASLSVIEGGVNISGSLNDIVPHDIARSFDAKNLFVPFDMPVNANFAGEVSEDGTLRGGLMDVVLGAGTVRLLGDDREGLFLDEAKLRISYDAANRLIEIHPSEVYSGQSSAIIEGRIHAGPRDGPVPDTWRYDLHAREAKLGSADLTAPPVVVDTLAAQGSYDVLTGVLQLYRGEFVADSVGAAVSGVFSTAGDEPRVQIAGSVSPMSVQQLKDIWPNFIAAKARKWVIENVRDGQLTGATLLVDLDKANLERLQEKDPVESGALRMNFGFRDLSTLFIKEMPPLNIASGSGSIEGPHFRITADGGHVDLPSRTRVTLDASTFDVPRLDHQISDGFFDLAISGQIVGLMELLDHEPLNLLNKWTLQPSAFEGDGAVALRLALPLREGVQVNEVEIEAEADLSNVASRNVFADRDFEEGRILVNVKNRNVSIAGEGKIGETSANLDWSIPFDSKPGSPAGPRVTIRLDAETRQSFGWEFPGVDGLVALTLQPNLGTRKRGDAIASFSANLENASLDFAHVGLTKQAGEPATLSGALAEVDGAYSIDALKFESPTAEALGSIAMERDGNLRKLDLSMLRLSPDDNLTLVAERGYSGRYRVRLAGTSFDAVVPLSRALRQGAGAASDGVAADGPDIDLRIALQRVIGRHGAEIRDLEASATVTAGKLTALDLEGSLGGNAGVKAILQQDDSGRRRLNLRAGNAGAAFRFAGLYRRVEGGGLSLDLELPENPDERGRGLLKADNFFIRGEPVIRRISDSAPSSGATSPGVEPSRIRFDRLRMPFTTAPGRLILSETVLRGPSVGGSVEGQVNFAAGSLDLAGTYVPAYAVNNLLSHVPVFGQVLTGGENGGLVGVTFAVRGSIDQPVVTINPMSAITPGVFRKIFDFSPSSGRRSQPQNGTSRTRSPSEPIVGQ